MSDSETAAASRILGSTVSVAEIMPYLQNDCFLSKKSATKYTDLGMRKIKEGISSGKLRAFRIGRKILLRRSDVDAWIQAGEVTREKQTQDKSDLQRLTDLALERARANVAARKRQP